VPSDPRWTGGTANREWTRGHRAGHAINRDRLTTDVKQYLTDCHANRAILNAAYHPTEAGALKIICHRSDEEAAVIRDLYRAAMPGQPSMEARDA
jgi:hypothetical protein